MDSPCVLVSTGLNPGNDLVEMIERYGHRHSFTHLRSTKTIDGKDWCFYAADQCQRINANQKYSIQYFNMSGGVDKKINVPRKTLKNIAT